MDSCTSTEDMVSQCKSIHENILLDIIKECCVPDSHLPSKLAGKVNRIISDCDLTHYSNLHKLRSADDSTATVLGFMNQIAAELTFDEQVQLNNTVLQKIESKLPALNSELDQLQQTMCAKRSCKDEIQIQKSLDEKLKDLKEQESEKVDLMMEWLNHRMQHASTFSSNSAELLTLKGKILEMKSRILHLQILQNMFTEINQSIKSYAEIHKDLKESIQETEKRIKQYKDIEQLADIE